MEVREKLAAARRLPFKRFAECVAIDRDQHEIGLSRKMSRRGFGDLGAGREMNEAVTRVDVRSAVKPGARGRLPRNSFADLVNGRHDPTLGSSIAARPYRALSIQAIIPIIVGARALSVL